MLDLPSLLDALLGHLEPAALVRRRVLAAQVCGLDLVAGGGAAADEDLGGEERRVQRQEGGAAVEGVGHAHAVGDVGEDGLGVLLDVVDDGLVVGNHEDAAVGESEDTG